jgi:DNA-binding transcriptional ArsR family regulator
MLKRLFTSSARIKILDLFFHNTEDEYYIRELTRLLDEQINSVRRELTNLKKAGLLKSKTKTRKKYYYLDKESMLYEEFKSIFLKAGAQNTNLSQAISKLGNIKLLVLSGDFVQTEADADLLIVGDIDKLELANHLESTIEYPVRFSVMSQEDFNYRIECNDQFVLSMIKNPKSITPINKLGNI